MTEKALDYNDLGLFYWFYNLILISIIFTTETLFPRSKLGVVSLSITMGDLVRKYLGK